MSTPTIIVVSKSDYWIRVNISLEFCVKEALIDILHNNGNDPSYTGLPTDPVQLHQHMTRRRGNRNYRHLKPDQWALLCPANGQTDSREWDITLLVFVIKNELRFPNNSTLPGHMDKARLLRNRLKHGAVNSISTLQQFDGYWDEIEKILIGLSYKNMALFHELKTSTLDKYNATILNIVRDFKTELNVLKNEASDNTNEIQQTNNKIDVLKQSLMNVANDVEQIKENLKVTNNQINNKIDVINQKVSNMEITINANNVTTG